MFWLAKIKYANFIAIQIVPRRLYNNIGNESRTSYDNATNNNISTINTVGTTTLYTKELDGKSEYFVL